MIDDVFDIVGDVLGAILGQAVDAAVDGVSGPPRRMRAPTGARRLDAHTQQVWVDALLAAAHVDDANLAADEQLAIEHGLAALGPPGTARAHMLVQAARRVRRELPLGIVSGAILEMDEGSRRPLTEAVVAIVLAGSSAGARRDDVLQCVREACEIEEGAWRALLDAARARVATT